MKKFFLNLLSVMLIGGVLSGCVSSNTGSSNDGGSDGDSANDKLTIAVVPKLIGIPYFNASEKGALAAGKELGVEVEYTGPTQADAAGQVKIIEDLISRNVDVIAVAPNDPAAVEPVLRKAKDQGIHIMDWDTPANNVDISVRSVDDEEFGRHSAKKLIEAMGTEEGEIAILTGGLSAANLNAWIEYALKEFEENYPGIKVVTEKIPTDEKQQVAHQKTLDLIKSYPNLKGILAMSTPAPLGAAQAIQEKGLQDKISVVGTALPTDSLPFLQDGSLDTAVLWNPSNLGYLTVALGKLLAEEKQIEDGMNIEGIGEITVLEDGISVIMAPPADFTKENAADYDF
ncbi:autoinducer 2 ABC transporter substrate-binding protein [Mesobacillus maritimus]|uniref:autoinducer 2 ABC transporter substrate-binding protein n=1 Tax=Mesobacillus maritimus TaxID=1643336 RepID=UPI00384CAFFC